MSVYQYKNGRWYYKFQIRGRQYHKAIPEATDLKSAKKAEAIIRAELLQGKFKLAEGQGEMLFTKLVDCYIDYANTNNSSPKSSISVANRFRKYFSNKKLCEITPNAIDRYRKEQKSQFKDKKEKKPISNTTINRELEIIRKMFNIAIDNGWYYDTNPASSKVVKKLREDNKIERFLDPKEEKVLLKHCVGEHSYMKPIIICALNTGMRKGEILSLKWDCVNFKDGFVTLLHTKSNKVRKIPISSYLKPIFKDLKKEKCCDYVFSNPITKNRYSDLKRSFKRLCKNAKITNFRFHDLRHSAGTRMATSGIDLVVVQEILGHADIRTTMRYTHAVTERKLSAVEALAKFSKKAERAKNTKKKTD